MFAYQYFYARLAKNIGRLGIVELYHEAGEGGNLEPICTQPAPRLPKAYQPFVYKET